MVHIGLYLGVQEYVWIYFTNSHHSYSRIPVCIIIHPNWLDLSHIFPILSPYYPHIIPIFLAKLYHNSCEQPPPMRHAQVAAAAALAAETTLPRMADVLTCSIKL